MNRLNNWRSRIQDLIDARENLSFEYGVNDCALFGADIVEAITGEDHAKEFRGKYKTKIGGLRAIRKAGYADQIEFVEKNFKEIPNAFASFGDIGFIQTNDGLAICLICGNVVLSLGDTGLVRSNIFSVVKSFRVGG